MALAFTLLVDDPDATNGTAYATPAVTPAGGCGIVVGVLHDPAGAPALDTPTWLTGAWTNEGTIDAGGNLGLTVFTGKTVGSPGSDDLNTSFGSSQTGCHVFVVQVEGQNTTDFALQPKTGGGTVAASQSITLDAALGDAANAMLAFFAHAVNEAHTPTGGETELGDSGHPNPGRRMSVQYEINDTTSGASWATSARSAVIALEVAVAAAGEHVKSIAAIIGP